MADDAAVARGREAFERIQAEFLGRPGVDMGPMFGSEGLRIRGKVFAFVGWRSSLVAKLPSERIEQLEGQDGIERMVMRDRPLREWLVVPPEAADRWEPIVEEALVFVDEITP